MAEYVKKQNSSSPLAGVFSYKKAVIKKFHYTIPFILQNLFFVFFLPLYKFFLRLEIKGRENFNNISGPIILAPNHTSELDPTVIPLALPFFSRFLPIYSVIYPIEKYKTPSFSWRRHIYCKLFFNLLGGYPSYSGSKDYSHALEDHITLLKNNRTVCIFPEGRCTVDGNIGIAHGGLGFLAFKTKATVVPIVVDTFFGVSFFDFILRRKKLTVTVLQPMSSDEIIGVSNPGVEDFHAGAQKVLDRIKGEMN